MVEIVIKLEDGDRRMWASDWEMAYRTIERLKKKKYRKILAFGSHGYKVSFKYDKK